MGTLLLSSRFAEMRNVTAARNKPLMASSHSSRRKQQLKTKPISPFLRFSVILLTFLSLLSIALYSNRTRTRNEREAVAYSLWLEPPTTDDLSSRVENFIVENAKNDVAFKPHVTLLGPIYDENERAMVAKTENLVREIREKMMKKTTTTFNIRFPKGAQVGQTYFQCVYLSGIDVKLVTRAREGDRTVRYSGRSKIYAAHVFSVRRRLARRAVTVEAESGRSVQKSLLALKHGRRKRRRDLRRIVQRDQREFVEDRRER